MTEPRPQQTSLSERILIGLMVLLGVHVGLSSLGFVPSEVSAFNQEVKKAIRQLHTIEYARKQPAQIAQVNSQVATTTPKLPQPANLDQPTGVNPEHIKIPAIDIDTPIKNPTSTAVGALDKALKQGVVHYPDSGRIDGSRPMFLFGHSSRLPVVQNQAYKSFNGLDKLSSGDKIIVSGGDESAQYRVMSVRVVDKDEAYVDFSRDSDILTLSTCTTFGRKENRVVVTARKY